MINVCHAILCFYLNLYTAIEQLYNYILYFPIFLFIIKYGTPLHASRTPTPRLGLRSH